MTIVITCIFSHTQGKFWKEDLEEKGEDSKFSLKLIAYLPPPARGHQRPLLPAAHGGCVFPHRGSLLLVCLSKPCFCCVGQYGEYLLKETGMG